MVKRLYLIAGAFYPVQPSLDLLDPQSSPHLQTLLEEALDYYGFSGEVTVESYIQGSAIWYDIQIANTNAGEIVLMGIEPCQLATLAPSDCCVKAGPENSGPPGSENATPNYDLFYEKLTYDHLDIQQIDYASDCTHGKMRNEFTYDGNHRVLTMNNILANFVNVLS